jgi:hypothetical protein
MTPRERKDAMLARIRGGPLQPHREGGHVLRVLSTPGRRTGEPRTWPIAVIQWQGHHYVCAPNRRRDWVRNLLAAGWCTVEGEQPEPVPARRAARADPAAPGRDRRVRADLSSVAELNRTQ